MRCFACSAEINADAAFCPRCGQQLGTQERTPPKTPEPNESDHLRFGQALSGKRGMADEPEVDVWTGTYSPRAMLGGWILAGMLTLGALVAGGIFARDGLTWGGITLGILVVWGGVALTLAYRRMSIRYRLTNQRLFHEHGFLTRTIDRIEVIDMDDITFRQGPLERMLGVGTIQIKSSDRTDPDFWMYGIDQVRDVAAKLDAARRREQVRRSVRIDQV